MKSKVTKQLQLQCTELYFYTFFEQNKYVGILSPFMHPGIFGGAHLFSGSGCPVPELALGIGMGVNALRHCRRRKARTVFSKYSKQRKHFSLIVAHFTSYYEIIFFCEISRNYINCEIHKHRLCQYELLTFKLSIL